MLPMFYVLNHSVPQLNAERDALETKIYISAT